MTNIVPTSDSVVKGFQVIMDSDKENCFHVINEQTGVVVRFPCKHGLYVREDYVSRGDKSPQAYSCKGAMEIQGCTKKGDEGTKAP